MFIAHKSQNNNNSGPTIYPLDYYENTYWYSYTGSGYIRDMDSDWSAASLDLANTNSYDVSAKRIVRNGFIFPGGLQQSLLKSSSTGRVHCNSG
jgi:hypothetical protein